MPRHRPAFLRIGSRARLAALALLLLATRSNGPADESPPELARQALCQALRNEPTQLLQTAARAQTHALREAKPGDWHRLNRSLALLYALAQPPGPARQSILQGLARSRPKDRPRRAARQALAEQPLTRLETLRRQDRYNRTAALVNPFLRLAPDLLSLNPQRLLRLGLDLWLMPEALTRLSPRQRETIELYQRHRHTLPADTRARDWAAHVDRLRRHRDQDDAERLEHRGRWQLEQGRPEAARQAFTRAEALAPESPEARQGRLEAAKLASRRLEQRLASLQNARPAPPEARPLLLALAAESEPRIAEAARELRENRPDSPLAASAAFCEYLFAREISPEQEQALRNSLETAARENRGGGLHWQAWRAAGPRAALERAEALRRRDRLEYIFLGDRLEADALPPFERRSRLYRSIEHLSLLWPVQWLIRSVRVETGKPVPDNAWREAAVQSAREARASKEWDRYRQLARRLQDSYEKDERFDEARHWAAESLPQAGATDRDYAPEEAQLLLRRARQSSNEAQRQALLRRCADQYPETPAGQKAARLLDTQDTLPELDRIPRAELLAWPEIWQHPAIPLEATWFDGSKQNGEIASEGLRLLGDDGRILTWTIEHAQGPDTLHERALDPAARERLHKALEALRRERLARHEARRLEDPLLPPLAIEGAAGPGGMEIYPRLAPYGYDPQRLPLYGPTRRESR